MDNPENRDAVDSLDVGKLENRDGFKDLDATQINCNGFKDLDADSVNCDLIDFGANPANRDISDSLDADDPINCFEVEGSDAAGSLNVPIPIFALVNWLII
jgi:hypothetical protein